MVSTGLLAALRPAERRATFAHERAHVSGRHHRFKLVTELSARANPFLRPLRTAVACTTERWADEEAARAAGDRRTVASAIVRAALVSRPGPTTGFAGFAAPGPVPRRMAALLAPEPIPRDWPSLFTSVGAALWTAAAGVVVSAMPSANSAGTMTPILYAATPF